MSWERVSPLAVSASGKVGGQETPVLSRESKKINQRWSRGRQPTECVSGDWAGW